MASYSSITIDEARAVCVEFGIEISGLGHVVGGTANSSFVVQSRQQQAFVLTVLDNHSISSAQQLVATMLAVVSAGVRTSQLMPHVGGGFLANWHGKPVLVKRFIEGLTLDKHADPSTASLGTLIRTIQQVPPPAHLQPNVRRIPSDWRAKIGADAPSDLIEAVLDVLSTGKVLDSQQTPVLCHGDIFLDNVVESSDGELYIIDWETASLDNPLLDLGITAIAVAVGRGVGLELSIKDLLLGYDGFGVNDGYELSVIARYAAVLLAFHRYHRHAVRFRDAARADSYRELLDII